MYGLNIHLISFRLNSQIIGQRDKIRVSITTIPEECKQSFFINAKDIHHCHHFFTVNITNQTKKIIVVFRKKSIIQNDPIIASTIIHSNEFPKSKDDSQNSDVKRIDIYEPISNGPGTLNPGQERKIYGQMQIQMSLDNPFQDTPFTKQVNYNIGKIHNGEGYAKVNAMNLNENAQQNYNNSLFVDDDF